MAEVLKVFGEYLDLLFFHTLGNSDDLFYFLGGRQACVKHVLRPLSSLSARCSWCSVYLEILFSIQGFFFKDIFVRFSLEVFFFVFQTFF